MLGQQMTAGTVITGDQIEFAALREWRRIAVQQYHGNTCVTETLRDALVNPRVPGGGFKRREKNTGNAVFDELFTQLDRLVGADVSSEVLLGRVAPQESVFVRPRDAGQLATNECKNFNRGQVGNEQAKLARAR